MGNGRKIFLCIPSVGKARIVYECRPILGGLNHAGDRASSLTFIEFCPLQGGVAMTLRPQVTHALSDSPERRNCLH
jgi:hypothetical protein